MIKEILLAIILIAAWITLHEATHMEIANKYNCDFIEYHYTYVLTSGCDEGVELPQSINEIVGYCIMPYLMASLFCYLIKK